MSLPPFIPGNKVTIDGYFHGGNAHLNDVVRTVIAVKPSRSSASGWNVTADGPGFQKKAVSVSMDAGWFKKVPENSAVLSKLNIIDKIITGSQKGKTDIQIDKDFQRHVTKADLIGCKIPFSKIGYYSQITDKCYLQKV